LNISFLRNPSKSNMALNLAPFGRWTLRDKAAQRRLALRYASKKQHQAMYCLASNRCHTGGG